MGVEIPAEFFDADDATDVCLVCNKPEYAVYRVARHFGFPVAFHRCGCGVIKQIPMPNEKFFEWFFNSDLFVSAREVNSREIWGYHDHLSDEQCRLLTSRYRYWRLRSVFERGRPLHIMKIGPATGSMLHVAKRHGHVAVGCDASSRFAAFAKAQYDVDIDIGRFERQGYPEQSFDVIVLFNVIENVPNLAELLSAIHRALKPGGHFILNFVDMQRNLVAALQKDKYFLFRPPVCYAFTGAALRRLLGKFFFRPVESYRDVRFMHLEKLLTLLRWRRAHRITSALGIDRIVFPIYAYPSRIVVAQRLGKL